MSQESDMCPTEGGVFANVSEFPSTDEQECLPVVKCDKW